MDKRTINEQGNTYGFLTVETSDVQRTPGGSLRWNCRCSCGSPRCLGRITVIGSHLRRGKTRSCGSQQGRRFDDPARSSINAVIAVYRRESRARRLQWSLNFDDCVRLFQSPCAYCGVLNSNTCHLRFKHAAPFRYNGIDRQNNKQGYVLTNVVSCCSTCNRAKRDMSVEEFLAWITRVHAHVRGANADR
jgi:5-methylcytosine-specific restriction endonuclease McrA